MNQPTQNQIELASGIFNNLWKIYKKYANLETEQDWEEYLKETDELYRGSYKGFANEQLFLEMLTAITHQLERNVKEKIHATKKS